MSDQLTTKRGFSTTDIVVTGLFSALVFVASLISIDIPTALGNTRIHLGNVLCLLSGLLLGPLRGGLAAGIGSALFDLTNPLYTPDAPFTFAFKFTMAFVCGIISKRGRTGRRIGFDIAGAISGALCYVTLYLTKNWLEGVYFKLLTPDAAWLGISVKAPVSLVNAAIAVAAAVPLALALRRALRGIPLYRRISGAG